MRYLIESDWLIDVRAGMQSARETINRLSPDGIATSIITVGALYDGAIGSAEPEEHLAGLRQSLRAFLIIPLDDAIMEAFARTRVPLRRPPYRTTSPCFPVTDDISSASPTSNCTSRHR